MLNVRELPIKETTFYYGEFVVDVEAELLRCTVSGTVGFRQTCSGLLGVTVVTFQRLAAADDQRRSNHQRQQRRRHHQLVLSTVIINSLQTLRKQNFE